MVSGPTNGAVGHLLKKKKMTKSQFSIADSDGPFYIATLGYFMDKLPLQKHSKCLRIQAFESLESFKMWYYAIGESVSSLHRESLIYTFFVQLASLE